ncbi:MAG: diadenylate cyclase [Bacteroidales bacterium]|jgi:hypothetical protein|nr:diadenylate cyclase [Bacteroidales bacterium]
MNQTTIFKYPKDFIDSLKPCWVKFQNESELNNYSPYKHKKYQRPPFPNYDNLGKLVETVFQVSFQQEESRPVSIRISYIDPHYLKYSEKILHETCPEPVYFGSRVPFNITELRRMAPAIDLRAAVLLVCEESYFPNNPRDHSLIIWGIVHQGKEWWKLVSGRVSTAFCPPNWLTLSTSEPGELSASTRGKLLLRMMNGEFTQTACNDYFLKKPLKDFFLSTIDKLNLEVETDNAGGKIPEDIYKCLYPIACYSSTLLSILNLSAEKKHGGCFIIVDDDLSADDPRLANRIEMKYTLQSFSAWDIIKRISIGAALISELYDADDQNSAEILVTTNEIESLIEKLQEFREFVAMLSAVDGAVVLTKNLRVLGFGGEIIVSPQKLNSVKFALGPDGEDLENRPIKNFGTRHRSVFRLCSEYENCIAFVISQDGGIKAVRRIGKDVIVWPDIHLSENAL